MSGSNLGPVFHQLTLDEAADGAPVHGATDAALDVIRDRFGADSIGPASSVKGGKVRNVKRGGQQWGPDRYARLPVPVLSDRPGRQLACLR